MQIVIGIPDALYEAIRACINIEDTGEVTVEKVLIKAVENGKPLPKGHGRLIDADMLLIHTDSTDKCHLSIITPLDVKYAPTIIEADKAESEDKK